MILHLNGQDLRFEPGLTVLGLVESLGLQPDWVVVEHNLKALSKLDWPSAVLNEGDQVEIVRFMGGG